MLEEEAAVLYRQIGDAEAALTFPLPAVRLLPEFGMLTGGDAVVTPPISDSALIPMMSRLRVRKRSRLDLLMDVKEELEVLGLTVAEPEGDLVELLPWSWAPDWLSSVEPSAFLRKSLFLDMDLERSPMALRLADERSSRVSFFILAARADLPADLTLEKSNDVSAACRKKGMFFEHIYNLSSCR